MTRATIATTLMVRPIRSQRVSTTSGKGLLTLWTKKKDGLVLAELPPDYAKKRFFFALTVSEGEIFAGLQSGDLYLYWRRYGKRLALVRPEMVRRSTGETASKEVALPMSTTRSCFILEAQSRAIMPPKELPAKSLACGCASHTQSAREFKVVMPLPRGQDTKLQFSSSSHGP